MREKNLELPSFGLAEKSSINEELDLETFDVVEETIEDIEPQKTAEELRSSFTISEINHLRSKIKLEEITEDNEALEKFKKEIITKIRINSVALAETFIFCKDLVDSLAGKFDDELIKRLKEYSSCFDDFERLRELIEELGQGDKFNDHLYLYDIKKTIKSKRKEILNFVMFVIEIAILEEESSLESGFEHIETVETEEIEGVEKND